MKINGRKIGPGEPCYIIAEGGLAHEGYLEVAKKMALSAKKAGANAFKTQHYKADDLIEEGEAPEWHARFKEKELTDDEIFHLMQYCASIEIDFLCTPHTYQALSFLTEPQAMVPALKIGSGEVGNWEFIEKAGEVGLPLIISTGMYGEEDRGYLLDMGVGDGGDVVLHCRTEYPAPSSLHGGRTLNALRAEGFPLVGYSCHCIGMAECIAAASQGAVIIEKHLLPPVPKMTAQDSVGALSPLQFKIMVDSIRFQESLTYPPLEERKKWATKKERGGVWKRPGESR